MSRNLGALTLLDPSGPAWPVMGVLYLFYIIVNTLSKGDNKDDDDDDDDNNNNNNIL
jgi:hypothetical protein